MNQGQQAPPAQAPPAQPAAAAAPPVLPAPQPPPPAGPAPPAPAFALGPGRSHAVLNFDDPNTGATATKLYNKAISPLDTKFDGEADNLAVFLASVRDRARRFNWQRLITVPIVDGTTRNLLMHYGQVSLDNTRAHATTHVNTPTRDAQDNDMFYYFLADSLTSDFRTTVLLYADIYTGTNVPVASALLKQIIILTRVDNPASTMHIREMLIESKSKLLLLKGNITQFNQWVRKQMGRLNAREQEAVDLLYYLWKAYKADPDDEFVVYIKDLKSQSDDGRATFTAEDLMVRAKNKYEARLLDEENTWGKPTEDQEKIVAMTAEINSLKKAHSSTTTSKPTKQKTNEQKFFECWVDTDFSGNWRQKDAHNNPMMAKSRSGWVIHFARAPITWASKIQTITALSTTEAEYIALSTSLREVIPLMGILKEATEHGVRINNLPPRIHCTVFEDNSGALELARLPKMRPRTKHINQSYHHFREHVERQEIQVQATPTEEQMADILTKPLPESTFCHHRRSIMGW